MSYKCAYSYLVFVLVALAHVHAQSHDLSLGEIGKNDRLLATITRRLIGIPLLVQNIEVDYPAPGTSQPKNISAINVKDHFSNGRGGYASVTSGGVGQTYARILLETQRGFGMNFTITIYGQ